MTENMTQWHDRVHREDLAEAALDLGWCLRSAFFITDCWALIDREERPTVPEVLPLLERYYALGPKTSNGGAVHIVTEDENVEDSSVDFCIQSALEYGDRAGEAIATLLRRCSRTQRKKLARLHGYP